MLSADFFVNDPDSLRDYSASTNNTSINWNNFIITANDEVYERVSSSISDTGTLVTTLIVLITVVSMVLIILILSMSIRSRIKEMGILIAVGIANLLLSCSTQSNFIDCVIAFPLAYLSSKQLQECLALCEKTSRECIVTTTAFCPW